MKQTTLDLIKNINENTFIPPSTKNELFELFQLDTVADLRKVSRNFMKLYEILEHLDGQTLSATTEKAGIVKFGTETGNAINSEIWKQAIGQSLGGYVSKVENKEAGKWYINDLTDGKIYKCIQSHTSTSFDITKFVDITNVGLSDKVENCVKKTDLASENEAGLVTLSKIREIAPKTDLSAIQEKSQQAWDKANDAQVNRIYEIRLAGRVNGLIFQRDEAKERNGYVVTGIENFNADRIVDQVSLRALQFHRNGQWMTAYFA